MARDQDIEFLSSQSLPPPSESSVHRGEDQINTLHQFLLASEAELVEQPGLKTRSCKLN